MPAFLKTKADEERWARAKARAKEEGHAEDWAYVTAIYKRMNGGKVAEFEERVAYGKEFLDWAKTQHFRSPKSHKDVKFQSLPEDEQKRIHRTWSRKQEHGGEDKHQEKMTGELLSWSKKHPNDRGFDERLVDEGLIERSRWNPHSYTPSEEGQKILDAERRKKKQASASMASRVATRWLRSH
jgi:hypothetical protein